MSMAEMLLLMSIKHGDWNMSANEVPQLCLPVIEETTKEGDKSQTYCMEVPEELLKQWLESATLKA